MNGRSSFFETLPPLGIGCGTIALGAAQEAFSAMVMSATGEQRCYFDTAPLYAKGHSEGRVGSILNAVPRDRYILSTKTGRYASPDGSQGPTPIRSTFDYSYVGTVESIDRSLTALGCAYLDIVFIHDLDRKHHGESYPSVLEEGITGALPALREAKEAGKIGHIGVAAMEWEACLDFAERAEIDVVMLAGGLTLLDRDSVPLLSHCEATGIETIAASPFNSGILATGAVAGAIYNFAQASEPILQRVRAMEAACEPHGVPLVAAALQYAGRAHAVRSIVVGHRTLAEFHQNRELLSMPIPSVLWEELDAL